MHHFVRLCWGALRPKAIALGLAACSLAVAIPSDPASAQAVSDPSSARRLNLQLALAPRIVNGVLAAGAFPEVGQLHSFDQAEGQLCSGTLIGCNTFLTSADCFLSLDPDPTDFVVFFQHAGIFSVESIELHPDWTGTIEGNAAVAKLLFPVLGVRPRPINTLGRPPAGTDAAIVGFGSIGGLNFPGEGIKRAGLVTTAAAPCPSSPTPKCAGACRHLSARPAKLGNLRR